MAAAALLLAAIPFLAEAWFVAFASRAALAGTMPDDSFYYLEIGQRAAGGQGFTFDGTNPTSGYHPLWQWLVTATEWIVPGETGQIRAVRLLGLALTALAFGITTRVVWRSVGPLPALGGLLLASHSIASLRWNTAGMETPVVLLALALCFAGLRAYFATPDRRRALLLGLASALLVLARLDMVVVLPLLAVAVAMRAPRWRNVLGWAAGGALLGVPYAVLHVTTHHTLLTTSASVKQGWVDDHIAGLGGWFGPEHLAELKYLVDEYFRSVSRRLGESPFPHLGMVAWATVVVLAIIGAWSARNHLRERGGRLGPTGAATAWMVSAAGIKAVADLLQVPLWFLAWYASAGQTTLLFLIGSAAGAGLAVTMRARPAVWVPATLLAGLAVLPSGLALTTADDPPGQTWQKQLDRAATWLASNPPPGRYGAFDAGLLGYRMDGIRPVVNLDGLVNDNDFAEYLSTRPTSIDVVRHEEIDVLINRIVFEERHGTWSCATTLWEGDRAIASADPDRPDHVYVLDVRACR